MLLTLFQIALQLLSISTASTADARAVETAATNLAGVGEVEAPPIEPSVVGAEGQDMDAVNLPQASVESRAHGDHGGGLEGDNDVNINLRYKKKGGYPYCMGKDNTCTSIGRNDCKGLCKACYSSSLIKLGSWSCVCGTTNPNKNKKCGQCHRNNPPK